MQMEQKRALIFANGEQFFTHAVKALLLPGDLLIAVDGGLKYVRALGLDPHLLIGDLDSVDPAEITRLQAVGARVEKFPVHKDETDLELAVIEALRLGCTNLLILGALGGRLDMTLANIFLLALPVLEGTDTRLEDGLEEVFLVRAGREGAVIYGQPGERVSLLPYAGPARGVSTTGLYYPLKQETLYQERTRGISNRMQDAQARVTLEDGCLICIHTRQGAGNNG